MGPAGRPAGTPAPGHQHPHPAPLSAVRRRRTPIRPAPRHRGVRLRGGGRHWHQRRRHPCGRLRAVHRPWRVHHQRRRRIPDRHRVPLRLMLQSSRATNPADWPGGRAPGSGRPDLTLPAGLAVGVRGSRPTPLQAQPRHAQRASEAARPTHGGPGHPVGDACGPRRGHLPGRSGKIVERWDVVQDEMPTSETVSGNPMIWWHESARQSTHRPHTVSAKRGTADARRAVDSVAAGCRVRNRVRRCRGPS